MPELPEVETTVQSLRKTGAHNLLCARFIDVWTDFNKVIKKPKDFKQFEKEIKNRKILNIRRRGKNILIDLSGGKTLLIHQKMTGHLLIGKWKRIKERWVSQIKGPLLDDPMNKFLHLIFYLDNGWQMALSDLRKFAKIELWDSKELKNSEEMRNLGLEPLDKNFTLEKFKETLLKRKKGNIKQVLMDQSVIAGIGNIYSSEILWQAGVYPLKDVSQLNTKELKKIYIALKKILKKGIKMQGESISDYRRPDGRKGRFDTFRKVYRREEQPCFRCGAKIKRIKVGQRSAYYCPKCQR